MRPTRSLLVPLVLLIHTVAHADGSVALKSHKRDVEAVAISPDGKRYASGGDDGAVVVWEGNTAGPTRESEDGPIGAVAFSPDGKLVAIGNHYGQVTLWDPAANKEIFTAKSEGHIVQIAFLPDGKSFFTGSGDQTIRLWDAVKGKEKATLKGPKYQLFGLALSHDGKTMFSCYSSGDVTSWNPKTSKVGATYNPVKKGACHAVALSADGKTLAAGFDDGTVVFLDAASGKELRRAKVTDSVNALAFAPGGALAVGTQNEELAIVDGAGEVTTLKGHQRPIRAVAFTPDGKHLVSGSMDMTVRVWPIQ